MTPRGSISPRTFKKALPWLAGILAVVLAGYVYMRPRGEVPGSHVTTSGPAAPALPPAATTPARSGEKAPSVSSGPRVSPEQPPPLFGAADRGSGRLDPFAPLVTREGRSSGTFPPPSGGFPLPPTPGLTPPPNTPGAGMTVTGIIGGHSRVAIVEREEGSYVVGVGERVGDALVVAISADQVILKQHNATFALVLSSASTFSLTTGGAPSTASCDTVPSQPAGGASPGQSAAAPAGPPEAPPVAPPAAASAPNNTQSPPSSPAGASGGQPISYAPGVPPGVYAPTPSSSTGGPSTTQTGSAGASGGQPISYAPGVPPGVYAPTPSSSAGGPSTTQTGPSSSTGAPAQPASGSTPGQSPAAPGASPGSANPPVPTNEQSTTPKEPSSSAAAPSAPPSSPGQPSAAPGTSPAGPGVKPLAPDRRPSTAPRGLPPC